MKEEVLELFKEGYTVREISDMTGLATGTVGTYVYSTGINKNMDVRERQLKSRIERLTAEYEKNFGPFGSPSQHKEGV